mmetsp:Transcript_17817/g.49337  ORF Transcript_17817/g.49337 Transcript_17817/m.49337 type:complete len:135 (-) Transcript_17817:173-577(-)
MRDARLQRSAREQWCVRTRILLVLDHPRCDRGDLPGRLDGASQEQGQLLETKNDAMQCIGMERNDAIQCNGRMRHVTALVPRKKKKTNQKIKQNKSHSSCLSTKSMQNKMQNKIKAKVLACRQSPCKTKCNVCV